MNNLDEVLYINSLLDIYKNLLTENQKRVMEMYYVYNLSLSEIGEELNISRAAVNDTIKKSINSLKKYENSLNLMQKRAKLQELCEKIEGNEDIILEIKEVL